MATTEQMSTIRRMAYDDAAREMAARGVEMTYAERDSLGDDRVDWLRNRLGLVADTTDTEVIVFRPRGA